jgi:hypothetical protein
MTRRKTRLALTLGALVASPLAGHAAPICDMQGKCYPDKPPGQVYHMDPAHPDRETPPPPPQYPSAGQGRDIVVRPNPGERCRLFRMRSVPNIEPLIVELCPVSPEEERAIRERTNNAVGADVGR